MFVKGRQNLRVIGRTFDLIQPDQSDLSLRDISRMSLLTTSLAHHFTPPHLTKLLAKTVRSTVFAKEAMLSN